MIIGKAFSESERIAKFAKVADNFVIFPGGTTTLQEAATLIRLNVHSAENGLKKIVLVGKEFFSGLKTQYENMANMGFLKKKPEAFFKILSQKQEILKEIIRK